MPPTELQRAQSTTISEPQVSPTCVPTVPDLGGCATAKQEAAVGIGYGAAALELWEEFVIRFFKYETQLGLVLPKQQIANHLQQLAQLYQTSSPVLSNIYALLSCLSPDQLPGHTPIPIAVHVTIHLGKSSTHNVY